MKVLLRGQGWKGKARAGHANRFGAMRVARYWAAVKQALSAAPRPIYSLAWDGSRLGGRETL
eukprot:3068892-Lingulodinium_polyedra.AAC.1